MPTVRFEHFAFLRDPPELLQYEVCQDLVVTIFLRAETKRRKNFFNGLYIDRAIDQPRSRRPGEVSQVGSAPRVMVPRPRSPRVRRPASEKQQAATRISWILTTYSGIPTPRLTLRQSYLCADSTSPRSRSARIV